MNQWLNPLKRDAGSNLVDVGRSAAHAVRDRRILWFVKREAGLSGAAEALWVRLQPIRHGDYGGSASSELSLDEARAVIVAGEFTHPRVPLDQDETALMSRLRSLLG